MESTTFFPILHEEVVTAEHWRSLIPELKEDRWRLTPGPCQRAAEGLRELIGMWIASGDQPDGKEVPERRSCKGWKEAELVNTPFRIAPNLGRLAVRRTHESDTARDTATVFLDDGTVMVLPTIPGFVAEGTLLMMAWIRFWQHLRWSIVRCHLCGKYDVLRNVKKSYKHGWHHRGCGQKRGAKSSRAEMLQDLRGTWLRLAFIAFRENDGEASLRNGEKDLLALDIVQQVNKELDKLNMKRKEDARLLSPGKHARFYRSIKRKWVTENLKEIREGAIRAKGKRA
jgi:hypothetical protein